MLDVLAVVAEETDQVVQPVRASLHGPYVLGYQRMLVGHLATLALIMDILNDHELSVLRHAVGLLRGPAAGFDRSGLVALGGQLGTLRARLIGPRGDAPALVIVERAPESASAGPLAALSERERQVAVLIGRGLWNHQIAQELWISVATVKDHVHHILSKTGLANRAAVAGRLRDAGLLSE